MVLVCTTCGVYGKLFSQHASANIVNAPGKLGTCSCCSRKIPVVDTELYGNPDFTKIPNTVLDKIKKGELDYA